MINEGVFDRIIRFVLAVVAMAIGSFVFDGWLRLALYVFALMMVISSTTGFCVLYKFFDIDTTKDKI